MQAKTVYAALGKFAPAYDGLLHVCGYEASVQSFVDSFRQVVGGTIRRVLDVGCGTGAYALSVLEQFPNAQVTAFDRNETMVQHLKQKNERNGFKGRLDVFHADVTGDLEEIQDQTFDAIITGGLLEHVPLEETVHKLTQLLKPSGYFMNSPVRDTSWGKLIGKLYQFTPYTREELLQTFTENGYELKSLVSLPWYKPANFKEAHIFKKS